jgi:ABC-type metal ion transport system substrate-binding protein
MKHLILAVTITIFFVSCQSNKKEEATKTVQVATTEKTFLVKMEEPLLQRRTLEMKHRDNY